MSSYQKRTKTVTRTYYRKKSDSKKNSKSRKGQKRCPTCGKFM